MIFDIILAPTARIVKSAEHGQVLLTIKPMTEAFSKTTRSLVSLPSYNAAIFTLKDNPITSLSGIEGKRVCLVRGSSYGESFDNNTKIDKYYVASYQQITLMVLKKRCFAGVGIKKAIEHGFQSLNTSTADFSKPYVFYRLPLFLLASNNLKDKQVIGKLVNAVERLKSKREFRKAIDMY